MKRAEMENLQLALRAMKLVQAQKSESEAAFTRGIATGLEIAVERIQEVLNQMEVEDNE